MKKGIVLFLFLSLFSCQYCIAGIHADLSEELIRSTRYTNAETWIPQCRRETGYPEFECLSAYIYYTNERGREKLKERQQVYQNLNNAFNEFSKTRK